MIIITINNEKYFFFIKRLKIKLINKTESIPIIKSVVQATLKDNEYSKLCYLFKIDDLTKKIDCITFLNLLLDEKNAVLNIVNPEFLKTCVYKYWEKYIIRSYLTMKNVKKLLISKLSTIFGQK